MKGKVLPTLIQKAHIIPTSDVGNPKLGEGQLVKSIIFATALRYNPQMLNKPC